ncbi:MAG: hypothetical protein KAR13_03300 [Desulfobulbaceae bacterium]|nr:hypothetical protein [Desulfobulbaceae bacterium]
MFQNLCRVLVDSNIPNVELRNAIYAKIPEKIFLSVITECEELIRPLEDNSCNYTQVLEASVPFSLIERFVRRSC